MSEKHKGGRMEGLRGFEWESFDEGRKKMTRPMLGRHFGENWEGSSELFCGRPKFVTVVFNYSNNYIKKYWDDDCEKITIPIYF